MYKQIAHLDFESYYARDFSLTKMSTIEYVRDERFKVFGCAVAMNEDPSVYLTHEEFMEWAEDIDWALTAVSAFNTSFDACVLTQHYNIFPSYYIDPQSAARAMLTIDSVALKRVAPLLLGEEKGQALVEGATTASDGMADYANQDNELARKIYHILYPLLSKDEQDLINLTVRQAVEPVLVLDTAVLKQVRDDAVKVRNDAINASGYTEAQLSSNPQFATLISKLGLVAPVKVSDATGEETNAFSNGDDEYVEFTLEYPEHKHIWDGRKAAKSNINITRAEAFLRVSELGDGTMPMPLKYCGAHTGRASGCDGFNVQNLPNKFRSNLRKAIKAPKGHVIVVADSAQIELRVNMWLSNQRDKLDLLAQGGDIYIQEAADQFNITPSDVTKSQRQYGKLCQLGLGFGMGAVKFRKTAAAGPLGMDPIYMSMSEAYATVTKYRAANAGIPALWATLNERIHQMSCKGVREEHGCLTFVHEGVELPSGRMLQYAGLEQTDDGWRYGIDKKVKYLWGGTLDENLTQALARDIVFTQMLAIDRKYRVVSSTHDEVIYLAKTEEADDALAFGLEQMSLSPHWALDLPLSAEGGYAVDYSK